MIVLGIDPGLALVGFGVLSTDGRSHTPIAHGTISTPAKTPLPDRLSVIAKEMRALIQKYQPDVCAVEELFFNTNTTTGIAVAEARGVIILTAYEAGVALYEYTPLQIKQAITGYGRADKPQMQQMVKVLLKLREVPKPDDAADALAVALCHAQSARMNDILQKGKIE